MAEQRTVLNPANISATSHSSEVAVCFFGNSVSVPTDYQYVLYGAGNITSSTGFQIPTIPASAAGNVQYDYVANHLVSMSGRSYLYDSAGNILSDGVRSFVYNHDNRLIRVSMNGNIVGEYAYDAFGRRVKKTASGVTTLYHYVGGNLIAETDGNGVTLRDYVYLNGEPLALKLYGTQSGMYWFINDHLGTPQKILDSSAQVVWTAAYFPFGKVQVTTETVANNFRFPGQYFDAESGLHYNWHRYYDPETGRYITADPIGLEGGINLYAYVMGNPVNSVDPYGLARLLFDEIANLVAPNNQSKFSNEFVICLIWQESTFDPVKPHYGGYAHGLMGITGTAVKSVNRHNSTNYDVKDKKFPYLDNPVTNIQVGTQYLEIVRKQKGNLDYNIRHLYGSGDDYPLDKFRECEECLKKRGCDDDPMQCLYKIHK